jgi:hypothetical protein
LIFAEGKFNRCLLNKKKFVVSCDQNFHAHFFTYGKISNRGEGEEEERDGAVAVVHDTAHVECHK